MLAAAAALFDAFTWSRLLPLITLIGLSIALYWMVAKGQRSDPNFRAVDFLREDGGKASWKRLVGSGCFIVHSWFVYTQTVADQITFNDIALYVLAWSGSVVLLEGIRALRGAPPGPPPQEPQ